MIQSNQPLRRFNALQSELASAYHEASLKLGVSDSAMMILYAICEMEESCPLSEIIRYTGLSKQTVNSALRKLEAEKMLYLEADGRQKKRVSLTLAGRGLAEKTARRLIQIENDVFGAWTKEECDAYLALTQRYLDAFKKRAEEIK